MTLHHSPVPIGSCVTTADVVVYGVGYHHAGLDATDRKTMETMFLAGELPVLCKLPLHPQQC